MPLQEVDQGFTLRSSGGNRGSTMLNKGPYVVEAVTTLADILGRMDGHLVKKQALLRRLHAWG